MAKKNGHFATCTLLGILTDLGSWIFVPKIPKALMSLASLAPLHDRVFFLNKHVLKQEHRQGCLMAWSGSIFLNIDRGDRAQTIEDKTFWLVSHVMHMPPVNPFFALHPSAGVAMRVLFDLIWRCWRSTVRYSWTFVVPSAARFHP